LGGKLGGLGEEAAAQLVCVAAALFSPSVSAIDCLPKSATCCVLFLFSLSTAAVKVTVHVRHLHVV
jgi:hypothetical protein